MHTALAELETAAQPATFGQRLARVRQNRLIRQNLVLFVGGLVAGIGGFVYHAIAGRRIPGEYGEVASLVSGFAIGNTATLILILILARYAAKLQAEDNPGGVRYLIGRGSRLLALPSVLFVLAAVVLSGAAQDFLHLRSNIPIIWLAVAIVMIWQCSVPRGVRQGTQQFS